MTRRILSVLAALALTASVGSANAGGPIPDDPMPGHDAPQSAAPDLALNFGNLPSGWTGHDIPHRGTRGAIVAIVNNAANIVIIAGSLDTHGKTPEQVAAVLVAKTPSTIRTTKPIQDQSGDWSFDYNGTSDGEPAQGTIILRTYKLDPDGIYLFQITTKAASPATAKAQAFKICKGAKLE